MYSSLEIHEYSLPLALLGPILELMCLVAWKIPTGCPSEPHWTNTYIWGELHFHNTESFYPRSWKIFMFIKILFKISSIWFYFSHKQLTYLLLDLFSSYSVLWVAMVSFPIALFNCLLLLYRYANDFYILMFLSSSLAKLSY